MERKLRHPHQVMEASELVINRWYRTPTLYRDGHMWDFRSHLLLGRVRDTPRAALGHEDVSVNLFFRPPKHSGVYGGAATPGLLTFRPPKVGTTGRCGTARLSSCCPALRGRRNR